MPAKRKHTPSGWASVNAVCCSHRGHKQDKRLRGGFKVTNDVFSYSCFNCSFKASWQPGRVLSTNAKKLLEFLGTSKDEIAKINFHCMKTKSSGNTKLNNLTENKKIDLPKNSKTLREWAEEEKPPEDYIKILKYMVARNENLLNWHEYYWTPDTEHNMHKRIIIPFTSGNGWVNGYSARSIDDSIKPKYMAQVCNNGYLFNQDSLYKENRKFVIIVEGLFDAISLDCVGTMKQYLSKKQIGTLKTTDKKIIIVPDRDNSGKQLVEQAIELGYSVSFPDWGGGIKDVADAVIKYNRLPALQQILMSTEDNELKIRLKMKGWFNV